MVFISAPSYHGLDKALSLSEWSHERQVAPIHLVCVGVLAAWGQLAKLQTGMWSLSAYPSCHAAHSGIHVGTLQRIQRLPSASTL